MIYKIAELKYEPDPRLEHALDVLFILHADHEQNCSTSAVRSVGSSQVDPYSAMAAGVAALYGPLHGGANEAVLRMLSRIETKDNVPDFIKGVKAGDERLMGFGHRVYKNFDPRAKIIKKAVDEVFEVTGKNPLLDIATELERIALEDEYFIDRKLYPNVDFYSGLIYEALGMPVRDVPGPVRDRAHQRLDRPVAGDDRRLRAEDLPPAPDLHGRARARLRPDARALVARGPGRRASAGALAPAPRGASRPQASVSNTLHMAGHRDGSPRVRLGKRRWARRHRAPTLAANRPWNENGMWCGTSARASSLRSAASSTSRNDVPRRAVEHDREEHPVVLRRGVRAPDEHGLTGPALRLVPGGGGALHDVGAHDPVKPTTVLADAPGVAVRTLVVMRVVDLGELDRRVDEPLGGHRALARPQVEAAQLGVSVRAPGSRSRSR